MIEVAEARRRILAETKPLPAVATALAESLGRVLAEAIMADVDSPPHDKSLVDGYAVKLADVSQGPVELEVLEEVTAGETPTREVVSGTATRIMTGAPIPDGAELVVMVEQSELTDGGRVRLEEPNPQLGGRILPRAASVRRGQTVLETGHRIRPAEIGLLAEVGRATVHTHSPPSVAVLATGNELTDVTEAPPAGFIRNSNGPLLGALAREMGLEAVDLGIARDEPADLREKIERGLECDILLLSGGVSAGVLDLAPQALAECGVREVFHKVRVKPGKPLWFGVYERKERATPALVFGLPGNPLSGFVGFHLFVAPTAKKMLGRRDLAVPRFAAELSEEFSHRGGRPTFHPSQWDRQTGRVKPLRWQGSADLATLCRANCLACFPAGDRKYTVGETIEVLPF